MTSRFAIALLGSGALLALFSVGCSSSESSSAATGDDDEIVAARMSCNVENPCQHGGRHDLQYCVDGVTIRQTNTGQVRLEVSRTTTIGYGPGSHPLRLVSDGRTSLTAARLHASFDEGDT